MTAGRWLVLACLLASCAPLPVHADSDEAWLRRAVRLRDVPPLLVLVLDTSADMAAPIEAPLSYDPATEYAATGTGCMRDRVYWRRGPGPAPDCGSTQWVTLDADAAELGWRCQAGREALAHTGVFVAARAAQWEPRPGGGYWRALRRGDDGAVECDADRGQHGAVAGSWFAADGATGPWRTDAALEPDWDAPPLSDSYVFFSGNYLNYRTAAARQSVTRGAWLNARVAQAAASTAGLALALVRFSHDDLGGDDDARGGMIALEPVRLPGDAPRVAEVLDAWAPGGPAPLAETLTEVGRWLSGESVYFGLTSHTAPGEASPSVGAVRNAANPAVYQSPFTGPCRPVTVAVLTAGRPSADDGAEEAAATSGALGDAVTGCGSHCLERLSAALTRTDLVAQPAGRQSVQLVFATPRPYEDPVRAAGAAAASRILDLDDPLTLVQVVARSLQHDAGCPANSRISAAGIESGASPALPDGVYYALSQPTPRTPWPGNLRRYALQAAGATGAPRPVGRDGSEVFDALTGQLVSGAWSLWAAAPDGGSVPEGGAVVHLPGPGDRRVLSDLTSAPLTDPANRVAASNPRLTPALFGLEATSAATVDELLAWIRGSDAFDADFDRETAERRHGLGDPGLRAPTVLRYAAGGEASVFVATNDGLLHAFDADSGDERWAFLPAALLPRLADMTRRDWTASRAHGLDGPLALQLDDVNHDGRIAAADGDRAWLFAALGRGGTGYYALDVTEPDAPELLWSLGPAGLEGFGQSWPAPVPARMRIDPARQGGDTRVVVLAGGWDPAEDARVAPGVSNGAAIAIVAATTGQILWRAAGTTASGADLAVAGLQRSTPSAPRLLDTDGDGLDDRAYLVDAGGRLWRFDFAGQRNPPMSARARLLADVGTAADTGPASRFQASPDVVYLRRGGHDVLAIAYGSGWTSRPADTASEDAFYVIYDPLQGSGPDRPLTRDGLVDVIDASHVVPGDAAGWLLRLTAHGPGEKVVGSSVTVDHRLRFATYQPAPALPDAPCGPPAAVRRLYTLDVRNGELLPFGRDRPADAREIDGEGLPPPLRIVLPSPAASASCDGDACARRPFALLGGFSVGLDLHNDPVRTSWRQLDATTP